MRELYRSTRRNALHMICDPEKDYIWRIELHEGGSVTSKYIGFCPIDEDRDIEYQDISDVPDWIQHRIAALRMMPPNPNDSVVYGVGRRVDESIYWVVQ